MNQKGITLSYIEYHVSYHCNLNCKGCGHFSNVSKPEFGNLKQYIRDLCRLKELFDNIDIIRLMGGEPLLNKELHLYVDRTRSIFPEADIRIVTNGLLLLKSPEELWDSLFEDKAILDISLYKPTYEIKDKIQRLCEEHKVSFLFTPIIEKFYYNRNLRGNSNSEDSYRSCTSKNCHFLQDGKISVCGLPILYEKYKDILPYTLDISPADILDIYDDNIDGFAINEFLNKPLEACRYCDNENVKWFDWECNYKEIL